MPRSRCSLPVALAALALSAAPAHAGGWGDRTYAVQPTTIAPSPTGITDDGGGAYMYSQTGALSRLFDDPGDDHFSFMPRNGRAFRIVVPGVVDTACPGGTSTVRGIGGQWFPETPDGGSAGTRAHVLCPQPDGSEWRVFYPDTGCATISRSGATLIGSTWTLRAPSTCVAEIQRRTSGKRSAFATAGSAPVPFELTGTVASSISDWR